MARKVRIATQSGPSSSPEAEIAVQQHGLATRVQLLEAGVSAQAIKRRLAAGRLHRVHRGVYAVGHEALSPTGRALAAVLACGPGAALSHRSAAVLWRLVPAYCGPTEVTAPLRRAYPEIQSHRAILAARDVTTHDGVPITTVARTLIDIAHGLGQRPLERAVNEARIRDGIALERELSAHHARPGIARLRAILDLSTSPTRSTLEDAFLRFVRHHDLPPPETNPLVAGLEVDALWRKERVVVELDGRRFHDTPAQFERDRERDAHLAENGYTVVRITWRRLNKREAMRLKRILNAPRAA